MSSRSRFALAVLAATLSVVSPLAAASAPPPEVAVGAARLHLGDVAPGLPADQAAIDLGPMPAIGGSRLVTREEIAALLAARKFPMPAKVPAAVRVVRKIKRLAPGELDTLVRQTAADQSLGRGVTLAAVRAQRPVDVPDGWSRLVVEVPRAPKKPGAFSTYATASFLGPDSDVLVRAMIPIDLVVSDEGAKYDAPRGAEVTLIVRRNLIEVRVSGVTESDADVGDAVSVQLGMSGRVFRAHLLSRDEALAVEVRQ